MEREMVRAPTPRLFVFRVSGRGCPPERYEVNGFNFADARRDAAKRYREKYGLSILGPAFDIKLENSDA